MLFSKNEHTFYILIHFKSFHRLTENSYETYRNKVTVLFWDNFAKSFHYALSQADTFPPAIIISCACLKRNNYSGITHLSNVPATVFYINPNCERVDTLRHRYVIQI